MTAPEKVKALSPTVGEGLEDGKELEESFIMSISVLVVFTGLGESSNSLPQRRRAVSVTGEGSSDTCNDVEHDLQLSSNRSGLVVELPIERVTVSSSIPTENDR